MGSWLWLSSAALALALAPIAGAEAGDKPVNLQTLELSPTLPKAKRARKSVKLAYMMSDDKAIWDGAAVTMRVFKKLSRLPPTAHSLVFLDEPTHGASLWLLGDDPATEVTKSPLAPGVKRVPANSLLLMTKIFRWVFENYPAEQRYLQIDSHGGGVFGIGTDGGENPYPKLKRVPYYLPIQGFARALRDGTGGKPFDVVFFNACLMANIEALYEIAPSVRYAVGSELGIGTDDAVIVKDMPLLFEQLVREKEKPAEIARALSKLAMKPTSTGIKTSVAMDLGKLGPLVAQVARLTKALLAIAPAARAGIRQAMSEARSPEDNDPLGDLWLFARSLLAKVSDAAVQKEAHALFQLEAEATLFEKTKPDEKGAQRPWGGVSIYMPKKEEPFLKRGYAQTRFARETGWDRLLEVLFGRSR